MADSTTIYLVECDDVMGHSMAFATLAGAREYRARLKYPDGRITKVTVGKMPIRQMLAAVYNREGFAAQSEEVAPAHKGQSGNTIASVQT